MGCECKKPKKLPPVVEIVNEPCPVLYLTTEVEGTLESNPPVIGKFHNVLAVYQGSKARVMYDSNGIPTIITGDGGDAGVTDFDDLNGRPKYAGQMMTSSTNIPDFTADINDLNDALSAEIATRAEDDNYLEDLIGAKQDALTQTQLDAVNSGIDSTKVAQIATNTSSISTVSNDLEAEVTARQNADASIQGDITALAGRVTTAEGDIDSIEEKIPAQASSSNQLADKDFVNSSVATNTASFVGTFNTVEELEAVPNPTNNDYGFVISTDQQGNTVYNRYKYNGTAWVFEYALNNSSFTANQWASINSGVTTADVAKLAGIEAGAEVNVNADWDATSGDAQILHKPTIPTVNDATLTVTQNGVTKGTFSANASQPSTIALDDTTYSAFTGTDGTTAGATGLVPAPVTTDAGKYLKADGTWDSVSGGIPTNTTFWGQTANNGTVRGNIGLGVNSSDGYTHWIKNTIDSEVTNYGALILANGLAAFGIQTTDVSGAQYKFTQSDAYFSSTLHMAQQNTTRYCQIKDMADPTSAQDAATKNYVDTAISGITTPDTFTTNEWNALWA